MCVAHGKRINHWFENRETLDLIEALTKNLGIEIKCRNSGISSATRVSAAFSDLVVFLHDSPKNGGSIWLYPDLAIHLAQWCDPSFAVHVSRWARRRLVNAIALLEE